MKTLSLLTLTLLVVVACKKDDPKPTPEASPTLEGRWEIKRTRHREIDLTTGREMRNIPSAASHISLIFTGNNFQRIIIDDTVAGTFERRDSVIIYHATPAVPNDTFNVFTNSKLVFRTYRVFRYPGHPDKPYLLIDTRDFER